MISKLKLGALAVVVLVGSALPGVAQNADPGAAGAYDWNGFHGGTAADGPPRGTYEVPSDPPVYDFAPDPAAGPPLDPDSPEATGGGSLGFNKCAGHARC